MTDNQKTTCIHCDSGEDLVPLLVFNYRGGEYRICTEHLPVLIHHPHELTGKLPDMDKLNPVDHD